MLSKSYPYSSHSEFQRLLYSKASHILPDLRGLKRLTVVDYGCGTGDNWVHSKDALFFNTDEDIEYQLILNDVKQNDWATIAKTIGKVRTKKGDKRKGQIVMLQGNFYSQCMPSASVDVGMAWSSFHYLDKLPPLHSAATPSLHENRDAMVRVQARADLTKLLRLRSLEIKSDGYFVCAIPTTTVGHSEKVHLQAMHQALNSCLAENVISQEQYGAFSLPISALNRDDLEDVLNDVNDVWSQREPCNSITIEHPAWTTLQASERTDADYGKYAESMSGFMMAIISGVLVGALRVGNQTGRLDITGTSNEEEDFLHQFREHFKSAILSDSLKGIPAKGSWWTMSLKRK